MESTNNTSKLFKLKALEALIRHETCIKQNKERLTNYLHSNRRNGAILGEAKSLLVFSTYSVPGIFTYFTGSITMGKRCCPQVTVQEIGAKQLVSTATNSWNTEIERAALQTQITPPRADTAAWRRALCASRWKDRRRAAGPDNHFTLTPSMGHMPR